jgi:hypothetical protein
VGGLQRILVVKIRSVKLHKVQVGKQCLES